MDMLANESNQGQPWTHSTTATTATATATTTVTAAAAAASAPVAQFDSKNTVPMPQAAGPQLRLRARRPAQFSGDETLLRRRAWACNFLQRLVRIYVNITNSRGIDKGEQEWARSPDLRHSPG